MEAMLWIDHRIIALFGQASQSIPAIDRLIFLSASSDLVKGGVIVALAWWTWFDPGGEIWARRRGVIKALAASVVAAGLSQAMQNFIPTRPRPMHASPGFVPPAGLGPDTIEWMRGWSSFPSDHATLFFALATGLWLVNRRVGAVALAWALLVASLPRIYLGLHYPSDILAGGLLGALIAVLVFRLPVPTKRQLRGFVAARPGLFYGAAFLMCFELGQLFQNVRTLGAQAIESARPLLAAF